MKKFSSILAATVLLVGASALVVGCQHNDVENHDRGHSSRYTCGHHPEIVQTMPGKCPKCEMRLVPQ